MDGTTVAILGTGGAVILLMAALAFSRHPGRKDSRDGQDGASAAWFIPGAGGSSDCSPGDGGGSCDGGGGGD